MNALTKAVTEIKYRIPKQILSIAFKETNSSWRQAPISIDEQIMSKVIRPRVLVDTNIIGGQHIMVNLGGLTPTFIDGFSVVYEIPAELLNNRTIISALSVSYLSFAAGYGNSSVYTSVLNQSGSDMLTIGQKIGDSFASIPDTANALVDLIGHNTVLIKEQVRTSNMYQLRCIVSNEENLNNLSPRSYLHFAKCCELAVKSYIYNNLLISIDQAFLTGGQELGSVKTYVESLSDAEENYQTYLTEVMAAVLYMNDNVSHNRFIKLQINTAI